MLNYKSDLDYKSDLNYKTDQNPMTCIDLTSNRSKMLSYVAKHSKQRKTTKTHQMQWIASIGCKNDQNKAKLQKWSKSNDLHRFHVKTIKNVELRRKTFKTTQNYKTHQMQWIALIGCKNDQNKAKLQKWSKSNDLHRFDLKTINNVEFGPKTFKTTQNYKTDQITMNCIDWMSKLSKQSKTTKPIKLQWIASIGCQNYQNKAKLQKWSISKDLHRFDVKTIKNVELRRTTFKTTQNYKTDQITMNCIAWMSERSKQC